MNFLITSAPTPEELVVRFKRAGIGVDEVEAEFIKARKRAKILNKIGRSVDGKPTEYNHVFLDEDAPKEKLERVLIGAGVSQEDIRDFFE